MLTQLNPPDRNRFGIMKKPIMLWSIVFGTSLCAMPLSAATVRVTASGSVLLDIVPNPNFSSADLYLTGDAGQLAHLHIYSDSYYDPSDPFSDTCDVAYLGNSSANVSMECGKTYDFQLSGSACSASRPITGAFSSSFLPPGHMVEWRDTTGLVEDNKNSQRITGIQSKSWKVILKPKRIHFTENSVSADGRSQTQAKLNFQTGSQRWFTGTTTWSIVGDNLGCTIDPATGWIRAGTESGEITVRATDSGTGRYVSGSLQIGCQTCSGPSCGIGQGIVGNFRNALAVSLGELPCDGSFMGSIRLRLTAPAGALTTPAGLTYDQDSTDNALPEIIRDAGALRQVLAAQCLADIVTTTPNTEYEIRIYWPENKGTKDVNGFYQPVGSPFKVWKVTSLVGGNTQFKITEDPTGVNIVDTFTWNAGDNAWTLNRNGLRQEKKIVQSGLPAGAPPEVPNSRRTETVEISGSPIASRTTRTYANLSLNGGAVQRQDILVEERAYGQKADGSSANPDQVTYYYYATTATGDNHEKLQRVSRSDGSWEHYEYDGNHRVSTVYTPWLDSVPPGDVNQSPTSVAHRKTVYDYTPLTGDPGTDLQTPRRVDVFIKESAGAETQLVSRDYVHLSTDATVYPRLNIRKDISCRSSTALWDDANNPVTTTRSFADGPFKEAVHSIDHPDGTRSLYAYTETSDEVSQGASGTGYTVNDGRKTITTRTSRGYTERIAVSDISTEKVLVSDVWSVPGVNDPQGRFTLLTHLDGTTETFTYDCCNLTQTVDRDGLTTVYTPDDLNRIWKTTVYHSATLVNGIETRNTLDAAGNVTKTTRVGDTSIDVLPLREYDRGGRMVREQNALLGYTTVVEANTVNGGRKVTTTYPDTGTRIEEYYRDGRLAKITGTAAQPIQYEYGLHPTSHEPFVKETKLDATGAPTPEWTKTYNDFLGRDYKTVYADTTTGDETDNPFSQQFYKDNGQLWKERDPDGVLTVYIYNARGEVEYTMVGLKNDLSTPPSAPDTTGEHRITRVERSVGTYTDGSTYDTLVTRVTEWTTLNSVATIATSEAHTSLDGLRQWTVSYPDDTFKQVVKTVTQFGTGTRTVTVTAPDGSYQISVYSFGRPSGVTSYKSGSETVASTTYQYDPHGRLWTTTDARNGTTTLWYNDADQTTSVVSPPASPGQPAQTRSTLYNSMGQPIQVTEPDGGFVYTRYYKNGLVKLTWGTRTYPNGYEYDAQGRMTKLHTWRTFSPPDPALTDPPFPSGAVTTIFNYDQYRGWLNNKRYTDSKGPDYTYSPGGRLKSHAWWRSVPGNPGNRLTTTYTYDFDPLGLNANRKAGYLAKVDYNDNDFTLPSGEIPTPELTFDYDRRGRGRTVTQANVPPITTTLAWHPSGALDGESYAGAGHFQNTLAVVVGNVDANNLLRRTSLKARKAGLDIAGTVVSYGYDTASRLQSVASGNFSVTYGYAANSHLRETDTFKDPLANTRLTTTRQYDYLNRLQTIQHAPGASAQPPLSSAYAYNNANQRIRRTDGDLSAWHYGYDNKGQVTAAKHLWSDGEFVPGQQFEYGYDEIGNRLLAREGGDQNGGSLRQTTYVPDNLNRYTSRSMSVADRKVDIMGLALVQNGVPTTLTINGAGPTYRRGEYFWKALAGSGGGPNWLTVNVIAGSSSASGGAYVPPASESFGHDDDGNLTSDARWVFTWDAENRLVRVDTQVSAAAVGVPPKRVRLAYDFMGRLVRRQVFSGTYAGGVITWNSTPDTVPGANLIFLYDGMQCIAALNSDQTLYQAYVWGLDLSGTLGSAGGVGGLVMLRTTSQTYFPTYDGNGNVTGLVNGNDGAVVARYEYGPFGQLLRISGEPVALDNPYRFSTKPQDSETDLLYYGFRHYSMFLGRWLSRDPIGERGGLHLFGFAENNQINELDPWGMYPGVPGHGDPISPEKAVAEIARLQSQADAEFDKYLPALSRQYDLSVVWVESGMRNIRRFNGIIGRFVNTTPGGRLNTGSMNKFVFTCKYGWIDMGHFFRNANLAYVSRKSLVAGAATAFEGWQAYYRSDSAFSVEDLESNLQGRAFGDRLGQLDWPVRLASFDPSGTTRRKYVSDPRALQAIPASSFANIASEWEKLLKEGGAVKWDLNIRLRGQTVKQLIDQDILAYRRLTDGRWDNVFAGSRPAAFSAKSGLNWQKQQYLWKCVCDGDRPKIRALRY